MKAHTKIPSGYANVTSFFRDNASYQLGNPALALHLRTQAVLPATEYDTWLAGQLKSVAQAKISGMKLRRAVIMRRGGSTYSEIKRALNLGNIQKWLVMLPPELAA